MLGSGLGADGVFGERRTSLSLQGVDKLSVRDGCVNDFARSGR